MTKRRVLSNRRIAFTDVVEHRGLRFTMTTGHYATGEVGEVFLNSARPDSLLDALISDAAIIASIALQFGCPLDAIRHALKRDGRGAAASPIGAALDKIK